MANRASDSGTVGKAMTVLDQVAGFGRPVRFKDILEISSYPKGTLYRILQTLRIEQLVTFDETMQTYSLGIRLVRLAHGAWTQASIAPVAAPLLDQLSVSLGETIHLAQLDNAQVLYVDKRNAARPVEMYSQAGKIGPAYCTGVGKAMMAYLPTVEQDRVLAQQSYHRFTEHTLCNADELRAELVNIRERGFAYDRQEHEQGIICVAVPILSSENTAMGAISVTSTTLRTSLDQMASIAPQIQETASQIAAQMGYWRFPSNSNQSHFTEN
jgi:IclR family KDG regulon transcriptional repressor